MTGSRKPGTALNLWTSYRGPTWGANRRKNEGPPIPDKLLDLTCISPHDSSGFITAVKWVQRLGWSLSRLVTQDIKTQPQINHYIGWI